MVIMVGHVCAQNDVADGAAKKMPLISAQVRNKVMLWVIEQLKGHGRMPILVHAVVIVPHGCISAQIDQKIIPHTCNQSIAGEQAKPIQPVWSSPAILWLASACLSSRLLPEMLDDALHLPALQNRAVLS